MKKTGTWKRIVGAIVAVFLLAGLMTGFSYAFTGKTNGGDTSSASTSGSGEDVWRIGVTMNWLNTEQFTAMMDQFSACVDADEEFEIVSIADCNDDQLKQVEQAESIKELGVDAWVVIPASSDNMVDFVKQLNDEGTPVICMSQGYDLDPDQRVFVGTSNYEIGEKQAEYIMEKFPDGAKVLYLAGTNGMTSTEQRRSGFMETVAARTDIEILADQAGDYSTETAMGIAEDWIQAYPEFDAVVCVNDLSAVGVAEALKGANRQGVCVVGNDGNDIAVQMIKNNDYITMTTAQDWIAHGVMGYEALKAIKHGEDTGADPEDNSIAVPVTIVDSDNVDAFMAGETSAADDSGESESDQAASIDDSKDVWRVGVTMNWLNTEQFTAMINEFHACIDADDEFEIVSIADCNDDQLKQVEQAESIKELGVDAWVVIPASSDNMVDFVKQLNDEGTPVICMSQGYDLALDQRVFVGTANYEIGQKQAEYIMEKFPDGAKVFYLAGTNGMTSTEQRRSGFMETIAERSDIEILADQAGDYSTETAMGIAEDWIQAYPEFDAVVCVNDLSAVGVAEALKGANKQNICVVGNDGNDIALEMIKDDDFITMTTAQDWIAHGKIGYETLKAIKHGEDTGADPADNSIAVPVTIVDSENVDQFLK